MRAMSRGNLHAAWRAQRRNRGRSFLTMFGVIIGVASVISVVAIGEGVKHQVGQQIDHVGNDLITVRANRATTASGPFKALSDLQINGTLGTKDATAVLQATHGATVVPMALVDGSVKADKTTYTGGDVVATTGDLPSVLNQSLAYGRFFTNDDADSNVAIVGANVSMRLFGTVVPLGETFSFHGTSFTVQGVFNVFPSVPLSNDVDYNNAIFIPQQAAARLSEEATTPYQILVKPSSSAALKPTVQDVKSALQKAHGDGQDFSVLQASDILASTNGTLVLLTELIAGVAAISLFVGGVGIMNITLLSVTERMHEIGIRKAVGATNRQIWQEFMAESIVLSVTGGVIGVIIAGVVDLVLRILTSLQPIIQWQAVLVTAAVSIAIGIIFGTVPAVKAARKDPISALRNE